MKNAKDNEKCQRKPTLFHGPLKINQYTGLRQVIQNRSDYYIDNVYYADYEWLKKWYVSQGKIWKKMQNKCIHVFQAKSFL